jgi:II/X family phage/plasmid replication protein
MIDWLTFVAPLAHTAGEGGPFYAGEVISTIPDPTAEGGLSIEWETWKRLRVVGSYSSAVQVKSTTDYLGNPAILVSGNPAKWFQGHNIFGSNDLPGLVLEMLHRICAARGITPSSADLELWALGLIKLHRVDDTESYQLGNLARVRSALRSMDATANLKHRGRGHYLGDSLLFGKGSRRWSLQFYAKGSEIELHKLPLDLAESSLTDYAQGLLRAEVRMHSLQLVAEHLEFVAYWGDNTASELHRRLIDGLQIAEANMIDAPNLEGLSPRIRAAYQLWSDGHDLRALYPRNTFYRYRRELLEQGIDVAVKQERTGPDLSNVVPIRVVLNAYPARVPEWAIGTPLYFEPRARVAA